MVSADNFNKNIPALFVSGIAVLCSVSAAAIFAGVVNIIVSIIIDIIIINIIINAIIIIISRSGTA